MKRPIKKKVRKKEADPIDRLRDHVDKENDKLYERIHEHWKENLLEREKLSNRIDVLEGKRKDIKKEMHEKLQEQMLKASDPEPDEEDEKVFCKDCAYRIRKFDDKADECLVTVYGKDTDVVTGKTSINYSACSYVNQNSDCEKFKQRENTFWERRKDGFYNRGFAGIFIPILISLAITAVIVIAYIKMQDQKLNYKNKTPVENLRPVGE